MRTSTLLLLTPTTALAALLPRQSPPTQIVPLPSTENLAARSNGHLLATNMNSPNLFTIDPIAKTSSTALRFPNSVTGLSGIGEYAPDKFAVIASGKAIYTVDFSSEAPTATLLATLAEAQNLNGLAVLHSTAVLVADAGQGVVYRVDTETGEYAVVLQDEETMAPASKAIPFGIDGIKYRDGVVWYTNIFKNSFHRVLVDEGTGEARGGYETLWRDLMGDDLCFGPGGSDTEGGGGKIYVATNGGNSLVEVDVAGVVEGGTVVPVKVGSVTGSTSCVVGRGEGDGGVVYVGAGQGVYAVTVGV
ncbi:hypothetical protein B0J18DRAFT_494796 [Chaetomium sp. MPI-SDFR-AT-0129]|nr:hypothetical protein B0J18DRAFT_494796 [Chaetomium sp. MPI-SDFR-AT-0129]